MPYVTRVNGVIVEVYTHPNRDEGGVIITGQELLDESHSDMLAHNGRDLSGIKLAKMEAIDDLRDEKSFANFTHSGKVYDADEGSMFSIHAEITDSSTPPVIGDGEMMTWILNDNTEPSFTVGEFRAMARALKGKVKSNASNARAHKDAINALATVAAVEAYDITANW